MKHIVIVAAAAAVSLYLAKSLLDKAPAAGVTRTDTKGREIIFQQNKNGYLVDQYGGLWA